MSATLFVTPADQLAGILPAVISGGRPRLADRPTARFLPALHDVTQDPVWIVRDDDAPGYERDGHEVITYPLDWAEQYAGEHWTSHVPYGAGAFLGAFCGREHACRVAEQRGCWAVLLLDDNLRRLAFIVQFRAGVDAAAAGGGLALFADLLAAVTLSTNGHMTGAHLDAIHQTAFRTDLLARTGYPYSLYLERTGPGRPPYCGPTEDDILHAIAWDQPGTTATTLLVPSLRYMKDHGGRTGMRGHYDSTRSVGLQRVAPQASKLTVMSAHANGSGGPRVFHRTRPVRTPKVITDRELYDAACRKVEQLGAQMYAGHRQYRAAKLRERAARAAAGSRR